MSDQHLATLAIRAGQLRTHEGEHAEPIFTTSSYVFRNAAEAAARFAETEKGNIYSRFTNPTVRCFEERLAAMEGGAACVGTGSGMAAILAMCMALLKAGDHIVCSDSVFGSTIALLNRYMVKFGVEVSYVRPDDNEAWRAAIRNNTRIAFLETPSNPLSAIADIRALADIAHERGVLLAVDNCFCTPALQRPVEYGADLIIHSGTKYLDGQGRVIAGAICATERIVNERFVPVMRSAGMTLSPFNAWVVLKGLETLSIRMLAQSERAHVLATWLESQPRVERVYYPGLASHPQHELAMAQQAGSGGAVISFIVRGGSDGPAVARKNAFHVIDATEVCSITANLGDTKTTITHPASTSHGRLTEEQRLAAGITQGMIRVAVGLDDVEDIKDDLLRGLGGL